MTLYNDIELHPSELEHEVTAPVAPFSEPTMSPYERHFESMPNNVPEYGVGRVVQSPFFSPLPAH